MDKLSPDQKILYQAAERGDIAKFKEIIREVINTKGDLGQTPLYRASNKEEASYWISIGADVNVEDSQEQPLHWAVLRENMEVVKCLILNGATIDAKDEDGWTPLHLASKYGYLEIMKFLIESGAALDEIDLEHNTPLLLATENHLEALGAVQCLVKSGANVNAKNINGDTLLHLHPDPVLHDQSNGFEISKCLIANKALLDAKNNDGMTPLHVAAAGDQFEFIEFLIQNKTPIDVYDNEGNTPLHLATKDCYLDSLKCLLKYGALINTKNKNGSTPLHTAAELGDFEIVKLFLQKGAEIDARNQNDETPLYLSTKDENLEVMKLLIQNGAQVNAKEKDGYTPLHFASSRGRLEVVKCLIEKGARIDVQDDKNGRTPYFLAVKNDHTYVVNYLTATKKRKAENEPEETFGSKSPCIICYAPRNGFYVLLPCGHTCFCELCCIKLTCKDDLNSKCPSCRKAINSYQKVFFQEPE